jgi:hypothetical protein
MAFLLNLASLGGLLDSPIFESIGKCFDDCSDCGTFCEMRYNKVVRKCKKVKKSVIKDKPKTEIMK